MRTCGFFDTAVMSLSKESTDKCRSMAIGTLVFRVLLFELFSLLQRLKDKIYLNNY